MPTCTIDGKKIEFSTGENLVEIAKKAGIHIPVYCYHPALRVVAQCRMCAVEIEGMPKLQTACSTAAQEGMVVHTTSEKTVKNRESIMEFLLINHPLDCPVCDEAGECELQDFSYEHGSPYMRYSEERRTYVDLDMGPVIKKNMNRCIHCTRCIRFGEEVAGIHEMVALQRGNNVEITTVDGKALETDYAGNYADICPTGSLTLKDFRFKKRAWMLKKTPSICEGCSKGCNIELHWDHGVVHRTVPRENQSINKHWLCDEGRFHFRDTQDTKRILTPLVLENGSQHESSWGDAVSCVRRLIQGKKGVVLIGTDLTTEEMKQAQNFAKEHCNGAATFHFGTPGVLSSKDDADEDSILKRKSKTSNLNGAEKMGLMPFQKLTTGEEFAIIFSGGRAIVPVRDEKTIKIGIGMFLKTEVKNFNVILPGPAFTEKSGTIFNYQGVEQKINKAINPPGDCMEIGCILDQVSKAQTAGVA